jgi:hypothetical protein
MQVGAMFVTQYFIFDILNHFSLLLFRVGICFKIIFSHSGVSWTQGASTVTTTIYCVAQSPVTPNSIALAAGASGYFAKTVDGGATWTRIVLYSTAITSEWRLFCDFRMFSVGVVLMLRLFLTG